MSRRQRRGKDDEVAFLERGVQFAANDAVRQFRVRIDAENPAAETAQALGDGAADLPHADNGDGRAVEAGAIQNRTPAIERTGPHDLVAVADHPAKADGEADRELRGRLGQEVRNDRHPDSGVGAGLDIEIVAALERAGHDAQPAAMLEECTVDAIGHERQHGVRIGGAPLQLRARPGRAIRIGIDIVRSRQAAPASRHAPNW